MQDFDYANCSVADAPKIRATIQYLKDLEASDGLVTRKARSVILRTIPPAVLAEVARLLAEVK